MKAKLSYPSIWISIIQEIESLKLYGIDLLRYITPILGNGMNTSFWETKWCGDVAFKDLAPRIYVLETMIGIEVALKMSHGELEFSLRRNVGVE